MRAGNSTAGITLQAWIAFCTSLAVLFLLVAAQPAQSSNDELVWSPSPSGSYFRALLYQAKYAEAMYWAETAMSGADIDKGANLSSAMDAWTQIWRCFGYTPAVSRIREMAVLYPRVDRHVGFRPDLTIEADITWMELKNSDFWQFSVFLFRVVDRHNKPLAMDGCSVRILDVDGRLWEADVIDSSHKLWKNLRRIADTFAISGAVMPGYTYSFKQVFGIPDMTSDRIRLVIVETGRGTVEIPFVENLTGNADLGALYAR